MILFFLVFSVILNILLAIVIFRLSSRLLAFDDVFQLLVDDIDVNIKFFAKLLSTPLFENSQEVREANKNMGIISMRLDEFVKRMEETTGKNLRKPPPTPPNPPVVS